MIRFNTTPERYEVKRWGLWRDNEQITEAQQLSAGDSVKMNVAFTNLMIDKECVLLIRAYSEGRLTAMTAQEVTIYPDVLPFDLTSDALVISEKPDRIELALYRDFATVTQEEEDQFLLGKHIHGVVPAQLDARTDSFVRVDETTSEHPSPYLGDYEPCRKLFHGAVCFAQDSDALWIYDAKYRAEETVIRKEKKLWVPLKTAENLFGRKFEGEGSYIELSKLAESLGAYSYTNRFGLGVISDLPYDYAETKYQKQGQFMMRLLEFDRPKAAEFKKRFRKRVRPRCLGTQAEVERALQLAKTDKEAKWLSDKLVERADGVMKKPVQYKLDRDRTQSCFVTAIVDYDEIMALYWAYRVKNDRSYLERLKEHVLAMAGLENWCGDHFFLMTSRALISLGLAYDFLYDEFTPQEREIMAHAMVEKGFQPALDLYYGHGDEALWPWVIRRTNWNSIPNSGIIFAACVLFGEYETDICADVLEKAAQSLEYALLYLAPDGELFEGLGYAAYSWNYLVFGFQALESTFGTAFRLDTAAGSQHSYQIPFTLMTSVGTFSQGDVPTSLRLNTAYTLWWARRFQDHGIQCMRHMQIASKDKSDPTFTDMLWYDDKASDTADFDLDYLYESTQSAISRGGWRKEDAVLSVHAGDNTLEHSHADLGSFEYELLGFRFAKEMGLDDKIYCAPGSQYQLRGHDDYYVARAEGHNVYVINPDRSLGQQSIGQAKVEVLKLEKEQVLYRVNMESAYRGQVKDAKRYYELKENRSVFTVQDEIVPMHSGDKVYWFWHTFADIGLTDPRAVEMADNTVILTAPGDRKLHIQFDANIPFVLRKGMSLPLETSPAPFDQLQGGIISNLLTVYFETGDQPILLRATAWEEGRDYITESLKPYEVSRY